MKKYWLIIIGVWLSGVSVTNAQKVAIKTNLFYDATTTINLGVEFGLRPRWSLDISGNYNPWSFTENKKWKHWLVQPELRYWFCEKFNGHFLGLHLHGGQYNMGNINTSIKFWGSDFSLLKTRRYQGWFVGGGLGYGFSWVLGRHWNLEAELGFGYVYTRFDKYDCVKCGEKLGSNDHHYWGPTKAAINLIYVF